MSTISMSTADELARDEHKQAGLEELQRQILRPLLVPLLLLWWVETAFVTDTDRGETWVGVGILALVIAAVYLLEPATLSGASIVLVSGLGVYATNLLLRQPDGFAPYVFPLVVVIAGAVLRIRFCVAAAALASAVLLWAYAQGAPGLSPTDLVGALILTWASAFVAWLSARPVHIALEWSWSSYRSMLQKVEELRDRQGVLNAALRQLDEACYRLEQANTRLARARLAADEARRLKTEFATNLSHELRAPLNLIIGFSEMIVTSPESYGGERLPDPYRGDVEAIYRNACHLSSLIDDVLALSQIDADQMALHREDTPVAQVVEEAVAMTAGLFEDKGIAVRVDLPPSLPTLYVDRTRIRQILMNLLKNAARFTDEGSVRVAAAVDDGGVAISVTDTGLGIPPDELPLVFQEFRQLASAGARRIGGSGLGLAISRKFARMHGGDVTVRSQIGSGSTFTLRLPLARDAVASGAASPSGMWVRLPASVDPGHRVVAVLGDDESAVKVFQRHLDGYRVVHVASPAEASEVASQTTLDAVVVVEEVPGRPERIAAQVRASVPDVPVVSCTLRGWQTIRRELGVAGYLLKPVTRQGLQKALRQLGRSARRYLVVDDDPEIVRLLAQMVRSLSSRHEAWTATSAAEALEVLAEVRPDAILLDLLMPGTDGYALLATLRADARFAEIPVIVVTGKGRESERIVAESFSVSQAGGLPVRDVMRCLRGSLDALRTPLDTVLEPRAAPVD